MITMYAFLRTVPACWGLHTRGKRAGVAGVTEQASAQRRTANTQHNASAHGARRPALRPPQDSAGLRDKAARGRPWASGDAY